MNGRLVQEDPCLRPRNQRAVIVRRSLWQMLRRLSRQAATGWSPTAGVYLWDGEAGD